METLMRIFKQAIPVVKAYFNRKPAREIQDDIPDRPLEQQYTSDISIEIFKDFLTLNKWSRPGMLRKAVKGIEVHWVANPKTSAKFNRNYFELRKGGKHSFGSTHFLIDLDGDIIQAIPEKEVAYSSGATKYRDGIVNRLGNPPYFNTLSIECTHLNWKGEMDERTYNSLIELCLHLCRKYNLTAKDIYLHYDITGKICHKWFVDNSDKWAEFKDTIDNKLKGIQI